MAVSRLGDLFEAETLGFRVEGFVVTTQVVSRGNNSKENYVVDLTRHKKHLLVFAIVLVEIIRHLMKHEETHLMKKAKGFISPVR